MIHIGRYIILSFLFFPEISALQLGGYDVQGRRSVLQNIAGAISGGLLLGDHPAKVNAVETLNELSFDAYRVIPDASASLSPTIEPIDKLSFIKQISPTQGGALWLGEHHNSAKDHNLQAEILRQVHASRSRIGSKTAVGLEQVQVKFQPILDDYIAGKISASDMRQLVEWDKRWMWPFEVYEPVFELAREFKIPLVALNVNSEDLALVEKGGFPGMPRDVIKQYIVDGQGFADFAKPREFSAYVDYVIRPSYDLHQAMGLLKYTIAGEKLDEEMPFRNFYSGRILWDEAMASGASQWTKSNPGGLLIGLVGADHVKFRDGIPGRYARMAGDDLQCISVMLNPTLIDTRPSGSVGMEGADSSRPDTITLQLRYLKDGVDVNSPSRTLPTSTGGVLPLADYLIIG